jgi:hypothetical protein
MKIEIGESLVYSYLKHIEGCRVVQTNWKTSGLWAITKYDKANAEALFNKIKEQPEFKDVFKSNSFDQLMKQAEIDVLGISPTDFTVFGIDVAFHESGLNYGDNINIVLKKILRTIFVLQTYFNDCDRYISYFVTPVASKRHVEEINKLIQKINEIISDNMITIKIIANDDFYKSIVWPIINNTKGENDGGELFLRAVKLLSLDKTNLINTKSPQPNIANGKITRTINGMKIGQFVQCIMQELYAKNLLPSEEIKKLQDKDYSKKVFNQNFEVLKSSDEDIFDKHGRARYYTKERYFGGYYLTSQWLEKHWVPFLNWLKQYIDINKIDLCR